LKNLSTFLYKLELKWEKFESFRGIEGWGIVKRNNVFSDKIDKNKMGGSISTYGGGGEVHRWFGWGNLKERDHSEVPGVSGRIILRWIFRKKDAEGQGLD
jgi:hypothetical protein